MAATISNSYSTEEKREIVLRLCALIIQGSVEQACAEVGIAESTFYAWVAADSELAEEYARARVVVSYKGESELERINRMALDGECDPKAANVASQNVRWLMGRRNPKVYGDKIVQEHTGPNGSPIQTEVVQVYVPANGREATVDAVGNKPQDSSTEKKG